MRCLMDGMSKKVKSHDKERYFGAKQLKDDFPADLALAHKSRNLKLT